MGQNKSNKIDTQEHPQLKNSRLNNLGFSFKYTTWHCPIMLCFCLKIALQSKASVRKLKI